MKCNQDHGELPRPKGRGLLPQKDKPMTDEEIDAVIEFEQEMRAEEKELDWIRAEIEAEELGRFP